MKERDGIQLELARRALPGRERMMLHVMIASHDATYDFSDDFDVRQRGAEEASAIYKAAKAFPPEVGTLYEAWHAPPDRGGVVSQKWGWQAEHGRVLVSAKVSPWKNAEAFRAAHDGLRTELMEGVRSGAEAFYHVSRMKSTDPAVARRLATVSGAIASVTADPAKRSRLGLEALGTMADSLRSVIKTEIPKDSRLNAEMGKDLRLLASHLGMMQAAVAPFERIDAGLREAQAAAR